MDLFPVLLNTLTLLFQHGHWMIGIGVLAVIALVVIGNGGGWFEILDANARHENSWTNIEFNIFTGLFSAVIIGGIIFLLMAALKPDEAPVLASPPVKQSAPVPRAKSSHKKTKSHSSSNKHQAAH